MWSSLRDVMGLSGSFPLLQKCNFQISGLWQNIRPQINTTIKTPGCPCVWPLPLRGQRSGGGLVQLFSQGSTEVQSNWNASCCLMSTGQWIIDTHPRQSQPPGAFMTATLKTDAAVVPHERWSHWTLAAGLLLAGNRLAICILNDRTANSYTHACWKKFITWLSLIHLFSQHRYNLLVIDWEIVKIVC